MSLALSGLASNLLVEVISTTLTCLLINLAASSARLTSEPVATSVPTESANFCLTIAPLKSSVSDTALKSGKFCLVKTITTGLDLFLHANFNTSTASLASAGLNTSTFGIARKPASCSIGS